MRGVLRQLRQVPRDLFLMVLIYLPGVSGIRLRRWYYRKRLRQCGRDFTVLPGVHLAGLQYIDVGDNVMLRENVIVHAGVAVEGDGREVRELPAVHGVEPGIVRIGNHSRIAFGALILGYGGIWIGEKCGVGPNALLLSESYHHKGRDPTIVYKYSQGARAEEQCVLRGGIRLEDGAGIASNVIVLPGARIGRDAWVSPGSVVRLAGRIDDLAIAKGDPADTVFRRGTADQTRTSR